MGFIGSVLGTSSDETGGAGLNYSAGKANLTNAVTADQANRTYDQVQSDLAQQQAFVNALGAQNGLGKQSNVFDQQQQLANQLQNIAQGGGPNPAQAMLNQATGQNVAQQAALMAGQRGTSANAGLLARQIANQGANIQQQAAGQGATMQANQSLNALGALQGQQANMANLASQQVGQQQQGLNSMTQATMGLNSNVLNAIGQQNQAAVANQGSVNQANSGVAQQAAKGQQDFLGGVMSGIGGAVGSVFSDENLKENIKDGDSKTKDFLDNIASHEYEYKDSIKDAPGAGEGKHVSPMAQELEKSELGKEMVIDTPQGKMVDYGKGFGTILAAQAMLNKRLDEIEHKYAHGGEVKKDSGPYIDPKKAAEIEKGATKSGWQPDQWAKNVKEGLGIEPQKYADGGLVMPQLGSQFSSAPTAPNLGANVTTPSFAPLDFLKGMGSSGGQAQESKLSEGSKAMFGGGASGVKSLMGMGQQAAPMAGMLGGAGAAGGGAAAGGAAAAGGGAGIASMLPMLAMLSDETKKKDVKSADDQLAKFLDNVAKMNKGGKVLDKTKPIPGKAKEKGDSLKNDTVDAKLSPGEIVIPRSVLNSKDPVNNAAKFVAAVLAKSGKLK